MRLRGTASTVLGPASFPGSPGAVGAVALSRSRRASVELTAFVP